jgi:arsenate reductase (glutaredoxin)
MGLLSQNSVMDKKVMVYGIPNCDTVKKSRAWLDGASIAYSFHDYKKQGVPEAALRRWVEVLGWEALLNKKGTTWRKLTQAQQAAVVNAESAIQLMLREASVIKRPVLEGSGALTVGHQPELWQGHL